MRKILFYIATLPLLFSDLSPDVKDHSAAVEEQALFTGPLLAPSGHTVPAGHVNTGAYLYLNFNTGVFNDHWNSKRHLI